VDAVFKALADPTRRSLLDGLFEEDGQTLSMLEERFSMTRFGVMKHLKVLEEAGLVVTRRRGREKLHFLNPVPIRLVHDRWVSKYAEPWTAALSDIKNRLESPVEKIFEIYIRTTPERLWEAIIDPEIRRKYNFGAAVESDVDGGGAVDDERPECARASRRRRGARSGPSPPARPHHDRALERRREERGRLEGHMGDRARWRFLPPHPDARPAARGANEQIFGGWPMILSGLKTWLETGELLTTPGSLMYG
jgi:DNA-binding transcriptional ArsR family regulator